MPEDAEKFCPLLPPVTWSSAEGPMMKPRECLKEGCALWSRHEFNRDYSSELKEGELTYACAFKVIAETLRDHF